MSRPAEEHTWDEDHPVTTLTFISGQSRAEVAHVLQADLSSEWLTLVGEMDISPVQRRGGWMHPVQLFEEGDWVVLQEPNGIAGINPSLTEPLSRTGSLIALHYSIDAEMEFRYARHGTLVRLFEPLAWPDGQRGDPLPEEADLVFGMPDEEHNPFQQAVMLAERLTGLRLTNEWVLQRPRPTVFAPTAY